MRLLWSNSRLRAAQTILYAHLANPNINIKFQSTRHVGEDNDTIRCLVWTFVIQKYNFIVTNLAFIVWSFPPLISLSTKQCSVSSANKSRSKYLHRVLVQFILLEVVKTTTYAILAAENSCSASTISAFFVHQNDRVPPEWSDDNRSRLESHFFFFFVHLSIPICAFEELLLTPCWCWCSSVTAGASTCTTSQDDRHSLSKNYLN